MRICVGCASKGEVASHLEEAGRDRCLQFFVVFELSRRGELRYFLGQGLAYAFYLAQFVLFEKGMKLVGYRADGVCRVLVCADLELVLTFEVEQYGYLFEDVGYFVLVHFGRCSGDAVSMLRVCFQTCILLEPGFHFIIAFQDFRVGAYAEVLLRRIDSASWISAGIVSLMFS